MTEDLIANYICLFEVIGKETVHSQALGKTMRMRNKTDILGLLKHMITSVHNKVITMQNRQITGQAP
jgi:hypothetical protein